MSQSEKSFIVLPSLKNSPQKNQEKSHPTPQKRIEEVIGLAEALSLNVVGFSLVSIIKPSSSHFLGSGKVEEIKNAIHTQGAELVIVDDSLSSVQQRNLERDWGVPVIDRTWLILEIFSSRARTKEARLQVALARLFYQRSHLVRRWTHLERQRGGGSFTAGAGETQIEIDRRLLDQKIVRLKQQLAHVQRTRHLHRKTRHDTPFPVVALVGYTNTGKSTLFNALTKSDVLSKDMLFATLDPTMRVLELPSHVRVMLSDTVGFISNLPTHLIAAFRSTLEEVIEADLIIHVEDASCEDHLHQKQEVLNVLETLNIYKEEQKEEHQKAEAQETAAFSPEKVGVDVQNKAFIKTIIHAYNKWDLLSPAQRIVFEESAHHNAKALHISARTGEGLEELYQTLDHFFAKNTFTRHLWTPVQEASQLKGWLCAHAVLLDTHTNLENGNVTFHVQLTDSSEALLKQKIASSQTHFLK